MQVLMFIAGYPTCSGCLLVYLGAIERCYCLSTEERLVRIIPPRQTTTSNDRVQKSHQKFILVEMKSITIAPACHQHLQHT